MALCLSIWCTNQSQCMQSLCHPSVNPIWQPGYDRRHNSNTWSQNQDFNKRSRESHFSGTNNTSSHLWWPLRNLLFHIGVWHTGLPHKRINPSNNIKQLHWFQHFPFPHISPFPFCWIINLSVPN